MSCKLYVDNNSDLPFSYTSANGISVFPVYVTLKGKEYAVSNDMNAEGNLDYKEFYQQMREGARPTTSQLTSDFFVTRIGKELEEGNDVLYLTFTSGLSGIYESSVVAQKALKEKYPDRKFITVDSLCASLGYGLLTHLVKEKLTSGASIEEAAAYAEEMKFKVHHIVTVEDLNYLKRSGRVSAASAFFGTVLQVKPIIHVDDKGFLVAIEKKQGRKRALMTLVEYMQKNVKLPVEYPVFLSHADCEEDAEFVKKQIREKFDADVMITNFISPIIGSHVGPGTVALFYVSDEKR